MPSFRCAENGVPGGDPDMPALRLGMAPECEAAAPWAKGNSQGREPLGQRPVTKTSPGGAKDLSPLWGLALCTP